MATNLADYGLRAMTADEWSRRDAVLIRMARLWRTGGWVALPLPTNAPARRTR